MSDSSSARLPFDWQVPALLIVLTIVPALAGGMRLGEVLGGAEPTPENARFLKAPIPVVIHVLAAVTYCGLGAFQFSRWIRRHAHRLHRMLGLVLIPCGLASAVTGLWMTVSYELPPQDGPLLWWIRLVVGAAMVVFLARGMVFLVQRDFVRHGADMMRAYALGLGAGTQVLVFLPFLIASGMPDVTVRAVLMGAGWAINLAFAEWVIAQRSRRLRLV